MSNQLTSVLAALAIAVALGVVTVLVNSNVVYADANDNTFTPRPFKIHWDSPDITIEQPGAQKPAIALSEYGDFAVMMYEKQKSEDKSAIVYRVGKRELRYEYPPNSAFQWTREMELPYSPSGYSSIAISNNKAAGVFNIVVAYETAEHGIVLMLGTHTRDSSPIHWQHTYAFNRSRAGHPSVDIATDNETVVLVFEYYTGHSETATSYYIAKIVGEYLGTRLERITEQPVHLESQIKMPSIVLTKGNTREERFVLMFYSYSGSSGIRGIQYHTGKVVGGKLELKPVDFPFPHYERGKTANKVTLSGMSDRLFITYHRRKSSNSEQVGSFYDSATIDFWENDGKLITPDGYHHKFSDQAKPAAIAVSRYGTAVYGIHEESPGKLMGRAGRTDASPVSAD